MKGRREEVEEEHFHICVHVHRDRLINIRSDDRMTGPKEEEEETRTYQNLFMCVF